MKYLCLIYENEKNWEHYTKEQGDAMSHEYFGFTEDIKKSGHMLGGEVSGSWIVVVSATAPVSARIASMTRLDGDTVTRRYS